MTSIELRQKRAGLIAQARALVDKVDGESRDFTDAERKQYDSLIAQAGTLAKIIQEREDLEKKEAELREPTSQAIKPDGKKSQSVIKRSEFDALEQSARSAYIKGGGAVED
jgi:erythromycin esterase-like protein